MAAVKYDDLSMALDFVSATSFSLGRAYVSIDTGKVYWISDSDVGVDEDLPADLETSDRYVEVPHKNKLDLGRSLALRFVEQELPRHYDQVADFFRRKGAYARFKDLLEREDALELWYSFEAAAVEKALREWCAENGLDILED